MQARTALLEGLLLVGLAILGTMEGARLTRVELLSPEPLGPGWYLLVVALGLLACGGAYLIRSVHRGMMAGGRAISLSLGPAARVWALMVLYALAVITAGYTASTLVFFTLALRIFGMRSWLGCLLVGSAMAAAFQVVFSDLLGVALP